MKAYFSNGKITIYHGDCRELIPQLDLKFNLLATDPPYGTQTISGGYGRRQNWDSGDGLARTIKNDCDLEMIKTVFPMCVAKMDEGFASVFFHPKKMKEFVTEVVAEGATLFGEAIWDKGPGLGRYVRYAHESIAIFKIKEPPCPEKTLISILRGNVTANLHPHEKPVNVMLRAVAIDRWDGGG